MTSTSPPTSDDDDPEAEFAELIDEFYKVMAGNEIRPDQVDPTRPDLMFAALCTRHLAVVATLWSHGAGASPFDAAGLSPVMLDQLERELETALGWDPDR